MKNDLQGHKVLRYDCEVHMADEEYRYEGSVENILKLHEDEIRRKKDSFIRKRNGRACQKHMRFDRDRQEWAMDYNLYRCGSGRCGGMCPVLGRDLDPQKGNVYYDVKLKYRRSDLDGTLFEGQADTRIIKGQKLFGHPVSLDICRMCVKLCQDEIRRKVEDRYSAELFFAEYYGREFSYEIQNVRAESRESRDLAQDLEDIRNGIQIRHASDLEKMERKGKQERRRKRRAAAVRRLEKKLLETGYRNMEEYSLDRRHADQWLGQERIAELEEIRLQKEEEKRNQPVQMSLFDLFPEPGEKK